MMRHYYWFAQLREYWFRAHCHIAPQMHQISGTAEFKRDANTASERMRKQQSSPDTEGIHKRNRGRNASKKRKYLLQIKKFLTTADKLYIRAVSDGGEYGNHAAL